MMILAALAGFLTGILICLLYLHKYTKIEKGTTPTKKIFSSQPKAYVVTRSEEELWQESQPKSPPPPKIN
jgi:hypothetical protein